MRWGIGRSSYIVPPGLYAIGTPDSTCPVIVTANYKLSYDIVRSSLARRNLWLLVLETYGINVWCAAGKGNFGTRELVERIGKTQLAGLVTHRQLQLPVLGAPGVAAHEVQRATNFKVNYATIRASDLAEYLDNGLQATDAMRELSFSLRERAALIPVEMVLAVKRLLPLLAIVLLLGWWQADWSVGMLADVVLLGAVFSGTVAAPLLLPFLPGASFACKGALTGLLWCGICAATIGLGNGPAAILGSLLGLTAVSAFFSFNFTGSTPFTSLSGVRKELRLALPLLAVAVIASVVSWGWALLG